MITNHKNISTTSAKLLAYFNRKGQRYFSNEEATKALPESSLKTVTQLLSDMTRRSLLMRVKKGLYCIIPYEMDAVSFVPKWHSLAPHLVGEANYYIGYYAALQIHNLITQPSLKEQIVTDKQIRPSILTVKDISFQFIYHRPHHFFGYKKIWIDNFHKIQCSDLEKTLVDCLFKPDYAGGIVEIAKAIYMAKDKLNFQLLFEYIVQFDSQAVLKRLGFLLEILQINSPVIEQLQARKSTSYTLLDTELPKEGKYVNRWNILQNIDTKTIQSAIYT